MNRIIYIFLTIILFLLLGTGYIKFIKDKKFQVETIQDLNQKNPTLKADRLWDKKSIEQLTQQIRQESKIMTLTAVKEKKEKTKSVALNKIDSIDKPLKSETLLQNKTTLKPPLVVKIVKFSQNTLELEILTPNKTKPKPSVPVLIKTVIENKKEPVETTEPKKIEIAQKKVIKKFKAISIDQKIETYAKEKLGQEYVWGATGPDKFDCSGFTKAVFHSTAGIEIPRVSRDQAKVGEYIEYKDLRRGDMVFFDTEKEFTKRVNHVGIYLDNGNFIHASSARKKVIITNFRKKPFYKKRFLWGRRVIKNSS